jgi:hypothetical protein
LDLLRRERLAKARPTTAKPERVAGSGTLAAGVVGVRAFRRPYKEA